MPGLPASRAGRSRRRKFLSSARKETVQEDHLRPVCSHTGDPDADFASFRKPVDQILQSVGMRDRLIVDVQDPVSDLKSRPVCRAIFIQMLDIVSRRAAGALRFIRADRPALQTDVRGVSAGADCLPP